MLDTHIQAPFKMKPENKERLSHDLFHLCPLNFLDILPEAKLLASDIMLKP